MRRAFSLVELAIVVAIIGLLMVSVSSGKKLVNSAKIRSIIGDVSEYKTGVSGFDLTYSAVPGDFDSASSFWSGAVDGDGDGFIEYSTGANTEEVANAWNHLMNADLVLGNYIAGDYPSSKIKEAVYILISYTSLLSNSGNSITFSTSDFEGVISPIQAYQLDDKLDDGVETSGDVYIANSDGITGTDDSCLNASNELNLQTVEDSVCRVIIWFD